MYHVINRVLVNNKINLAKNAHLLEWDLALAQLLGHEHHPGHPEEQNVMAGLEQFAREEVTHVPGLFGPAQHGEGPHAGGEPGVQHVLICWR